MEYGDRKNVPKGQSQYQIFVEELDEPEATHDPITCTNELEYINDCREIVVEEKNFVFYETKA